jgi:hypothetical protein
LEKTNSAVDTKNLVKIYKGETRALDGIDLTVSVPTVQAKQP